MDFTVLLSVALIHITQTRPPREWLVSLLKGVKRRWALWSTRRTSLSSTPITEGTPTNPSIRTLRAIEMVSLSSLLIFTSLGWTIVLFKGLSCDLTNFYSSIILLILNCKLLDMGYLINILCAFFVISRSNFQYKSIATLFSNNIFCLFNDCRTYQKNYDSLFHNCRTYQENNIIVWSFRL